MIRKIFTGLIDGPKKLLLGVADLRYERLNMPVIETNIHKTSGFSKDFPKPGKSNSVLVWTGTL
jgi:hypothetical protein